VPQPHAKAEAGGLQKNEWRSGNSAHRVTAPFRRIPETFAVACPVLHDTVAMSESQQLADLLRGASRILLFTGAGISTGSGIPDFRGPQGVWTRRRPVYYDDFMRSEAARIEHWDFKLEGWVSFRDAQPNAAHHAVAALDRAGKVLAVVTQNIDGLHARAGVPPSRLVELHGTNLFVECQSCGRRSDPQPHFDSFQRTHRPPRCACGGFLKPATISFGQALREEDLRRARAAAMHCDLVIALGSTLSVYPAAEFPLIAARRGVPYVIINRGATEHDGLPEVTLRLEGDVAELLPPAVASACGGR
jgi:NAD-dependent deacetylase